MATRLLAEDGEHMMIVGDGIKNFLITLERNGKYVEAFQTDLASFEATLDDFFAKTERMGIRFVPEAV